MDASCRRCGKAVEALLCTDCVKQFVDEGVVVLGERLDSFDSRLTEIEGEMVRLQAKVMTLR